jgi:hypothetical protein
MWATAAVRRSTAREHNKAFDMDLRAKRSIVRGWGRAAGLRELTAS